jgi:hypothetical protein
MYDDSHPKRSILHEMCMEIRSIIVLVVANFAVRPMKQKGMQKKTKYINKIPSFII